MNFKMRFKMPEGFRASDFRRNLREQNYEIEAMSTDKFAIMKKTLYGYLENGFFHFLLKSIVVTETAEVLIVDCETDSKIFLVLIALAIIVFSFQISFLETTNDIIFLSKAFPFLVLAVMAISVFLIWSTLRRDIKKALKPRDGDR